MYWFLKQVKFDKTTKIANIYHNENIQKSSNRTICSLKTSRKKDIN